MTFAYQSLRRTEHLRVQARSSFGEDSQVYKDIEGAVRYWELEWAGEGGKIISPPPDILAQRIKGEVNAVKRRKRARKQSDD